MIKEFVDFQEDIYTKEHMYLLKKARQRSEIVEGLLRATDVIDLIIEILRGSDSVKQAKDCLTKGDITGIRFKSEKSRQEAFSLDFTERQADAILAMPLSKLIGLEILKLQEEGESLRNEIKRLSEILGNRALLIVVHESFMLEAMQQAKL